MAIWSIWRLRTTKYAFLIYMSNASYSYNVFITLFRGQVVISFQIDSPLILFYFLLFTICHLSNVIKMLLLNFLVYVFASLYIYDCV
jgi:hypothetical protein